MFYVTSYGGPPALSWILWLFTAGIVALNNGLLKQPYRALHLLEMMFVLLGFWTALEPSLRLILLGANFLKELVRGSSPHAFPGPWPSHLAVIAGGAVAPVAAGLIWLLVRFIRKSLASKRKALAAALMTATILAMEPCLLLVSAVQVPPSHHLHVQLPPDWKTARALGIENVDPSARAYVELTDILGLVRFFVVSGWGGGFRVVTLRTPTGWFPLRWIIMWE